MNELLKRLDGHFQTLRGKIALRDNPAQPGITYGQFDEYSGRIYGYLKERGIGREDTVMLCLPRGLQFPVAMVGVWRAGAAFVVCEDTYAPERIEFIKNDCGCKLVIGRDNWAELLEHEYLPGRETVAPHDLAYAIYTSGTTGNPKGVLHEFGNLDESCNFKRWDGERLVKETDVLALNAPLNFVAAQDHINNVLFSGATLFIVAYSYVKNPPALIELYDAAGVTCTFMTPSGFRVLRSLNPQMRWLILGGEPCTNLFREGVTIFNAYNMSEAGCDLGLFKLDRAYDLTPVGQNRGGRVIRILDEDGRDVPDGTAGELCYENPFVRGYKNLPEKTAEAWRGGLFHSGDVVVKNPDGNIVLQGRNDDMIKINGNRIEPAEIEAAAKKVLSFSWVCAKGFVGEKQSFVALYYTDDIAVDPAYMREEMAKLLPYYMIPAYYVKIDEIPMLPNGKLNRRALPAPDVDAYRTDYAAPENETEERLCAAFAKVLELEKVGVNDDFYELGGDSLRSMELAMELEDLGVEVSQIYKRRTVRALAEALLTEAGASGADEAHRNQNALEHDQPLNYFQLYMFDYQLYAPYTTMWNMPRCWKYSRKDVDAAQLAAAVKKVLAAHPVFRTILRYNEDFELVQHYDETMDLDVPVERMTEGRLRILLPQLVQPFQLLEAPMYRVRVFETADSVIFFIDMHHIISDGTSMQVLTEDLAAAYAGKELPEDLYYLFMRDQYKQTLSEDYAEARTYFEGQYGGREWKCNLTPEIESRDSSIETIMRPIGVETDALDAYLAKAEIGRNAFLQTVALLTLASMEKAENVMLGWVYHGRDSRKKDRSVGLLIKEIPMGLALGELTDVRSMYDSVKKQMSMGLTYRDYPYITRNSSATLNDVFCVIDEGDLMSLQGLGTIPCEELTLPKTSPAMGWLMALIFLNMDGIYMGMNYTSTRYHRETMERYCEEYRRIAAALVASELTTPVKELLAK